MIAAATPFWKFASYLDDLSLEIDGEFSDRNLLFKASFRRYVGSFFFLFFCFIDSKIELGGKIENRGARLTGEFS